MTEITLKVCQAAVPNMKPTKIQKPWWHHRKWLADVAIVKDAKSTHIFLDMLNFSNECVKGEAKELRAVQSGIHSV